MLFNKQLGSDLECKSHLIFHNSALSQYCTEEEKSQIVNNLIHRSYHRNEVIFYEGQPSYLIYFICSGVVKLWKEGCHKLEQSIRFSKSGDMFGFWGSLENSSYSLSATAISDSELYFIKKDIFLPIVQANSSLNMLLHDYIKELKKTEDSLRNMAEMNVREKVAHSLLELMELFRNDLDEHTYKIVLSRREISALSAISEDRVSKQLSDFKKERKIIVDGNKTFIDKQALQEIIKPYMLS